MMQCARGRIPSRSRVCAAALRTAARPGHGASLSAGHRNSPGETQKQSRMAPDIAGQTSYIHSARHVRAFGVPINRRRIEGAVTGSAVTSEGLDLRRRRLLYQSWRRGMREMDLILGGFADLHMAGLSEADVDAFEHVSVAADDALYAWISGAAPVDPHYDTEMYRRIRAFAHQSKSV